MGQVNDPDRNRQKEKEIFLREYIRGFFKLESTKPRLFRRHMSQAPQMFFILNMMLRECFFTQELMQQLLDYTKVFMAQPLPYSIIPLETNKIILNEQMVPGLTKVLMIAQDFPMLNLAPTSKTLRDARKMNIIH